MIANENNAPVFARKRGHTVVRARHQVAVAHCIADPGYNPVFETIRQID